MKKWNFALGVDPADRKPIFLQISHALSHDIRRGRFRPGAALPGIRTLAETLSVSHNTVVAAYEELVAEGWITSSPARGMFVSRDIPDLENINFPDSASYRRNPVRVGFPLAPQVKEFVALRGPLTALNMGGHPDVRLVPRAALARAYRRALNWSPETVLDYSDPRGNIDLRRALAGMLATTRGMATEADDVIVTRGAQMALHLAARTLLREDDVVAMEALGNLPAWKAFRDAGGRLVPVPLDDEGLRVDALERISKRGRLRAIYVTPHHQYPTMVTLTAGRRMALLDFARRHRVAIIEDDYDHEFHYQGRPVLPMASVDASGVVIYIGTLSKVLAPGLRLGYVVAPRPVLERMAAQRVYLDHHGDHVLERALADLMEDGEVQRHVRRAKKIYQARQSLLVEALRDALGDSLSFKVPAGGTTIWARAAPSINVESWVTRGAERGVLFRPGRFFALDGKPKPFVRLGFAGLNKSEMKEAVARLVKSL